MTAQKHAVPTTREKPLIESLQKIVDHYLPGQSVRICFVENLTVQGEKCDGVAWTARKLIEIDSVQSRSIISRCGGTDFDPLLSQVSIRKYPGEAHVSMSREEMEALRKESVDQLESLHMTDAEHFLLTTLHEIGHFKFPYTLPKWVINLRNRIGRELAKTQKEKVTLKEILEQAQYYVPRRWDWDKVEEFQYRLTGESTHLAVHAWAWKEFLRRRGSIGKLLS